MILFSYLIKLPILKRLLPSLLRRLLILINKKDFVINYKDILLETNILDTHDRRIFFTQSYEEENFKNIYQYIDKYKIDNFIDVGANSGIYSLIIKKKYSNIKTIAFEPVTRTYAKLLRNLKLNNLENKVVTYNCGLSNKNYISKMKTQKKFGHYQSAGYVAHKKGKVTSQLRKLDDIISFNNKNILIKIDTEGHEKFVIEGAKKLLEANRVFLQVEILNNFLEINKILTKMKFVLLFSFNNDYFYKKIEY